MDMKVAYVSCMELPEADIDEVPLMGALIAAGHEAVVAAWDDPAVDWGGFDVAVVRATWNYIDDLGAFEAWIDRVDGLTKLLNPAGTMRWNLHKGYLTELEAGGVAVVQTEFFERGQAADVVGVSMARGWGKIVVKPTVSAGSFGTRVFDLSNGGGESAQAFFDEMIKEREMMVQVFMESVETVGETALVVIDGELTHAIEKRPRFDDQEESVLLRETISDEMRAFASKVLDVAGKEHLYARVDVMPDADGGLVLSELEMLEPSLFFPYFSGALDAFVRGLEKCALLRE